MAVVSSWQLVNMLGPSDEWGHDGDSLKLSDLQGPLGTLYAQKDLQVRVKFRRGQLLLKVCRYKRLNRLAELQMDGMATEGTP